jgi:hypothetical protein
MRNELLEHIQTALPAARDALATELSRYGERHGRVRLDRAARRVSVESSQAALDTFFATASPEALTAGLSGVQRDAIAHLDREFPAVTGRTAALVARLIGDTGLAFVDHGELIAHPIGLVRTAAAIDPASNSAWLCRHFADPVDAAAARWALLDAASATASDGSIDEPPVVARLRLERELGATAPGAVDTLGAAARGAALALLGGGRDATDALDWLIAPPETSATWATILPAPLLLSDRELVELLLGPCEYDIAHDVMIGAAAAAWQSGGIGALRRLIDRVPVRREGPVRLLGLLAPGETTPVTAVEARRMVLDRAGTAPRDLRSALVGLAGDSGDPPPWTAMGSVAKHPELVATIAALCATDVDWLDFDAPGEGRLPDLWLASIVLAGDEAVAAARAALGGRLPDDVLGRLDQSPWAVLSLFGPASAAMGGGSHVQVHGLNDSIAEAYGDVFAPSDPFSVRRPARR